MTGAGEILASNCKKPLLHNVWNPKVSWWQATYYQKPALWSCWWFPAVCGSPSCKWNLRQSNSIKSRLLNLTKQCVSQIEARAGKSISGFQGCVNKALCATIGEQNRANSLCFVHCFFLAGGEGSIAKTPGGNTEKLNSALLRRQDFMLVFHLDLKQVFLIRCF